MNQPVARIEVVRDTYFGTTIEDPYRWMEDWQSEEFRSWITAQAASAKTYLEALPQREALLARIAQLRADSPYLYDFQVAGGRAFYLKRDIGDDLPKLIVRRGPTEAEKILLDPSRIEGGVPTAIDWYFPSQDGRHVAYGLSQGGSENSVLHVLEVESGQILNLAISRTSYTHVDWLEDNRSFVYLRFPELPADAPVTDRYKNSKTYVHRLGNDPEQDPVVFGQGASTGVEIAPDDYPQLIISPASDWMLGVVVHGDLTEISIYAAPRAMLTDPANCRWTKIADVDDAVTGYAFIDDTIYLRTHKDALRYKVIATSLEHPDLTNAAVIVPESEMVIEDIRIAGDFLLTCDLDGGIGRIRRFKRSDGESEQISLPLEGKIGEWTNQTASSDIMVLLSSWTVSPRLYRYSTPSGEMTDTGWYPPSPADFSEVEAHEVLVPARDGTLIPLSIIHKKGLPLDGKNPTILRGYGSFGIAIHPLFAPSMLAWYERGGIMALAHIRGGGEYGKEWHLAGQKLNKQNTIDDFIACAEYLVQQQYTSPARLAGEGGSAGGIPTGGALVQRPDLWAAMVMHVPAVNALRNEFTENGPPNIPEFGSVTTEDGFKSLQIIDAYSKVKDGGKYPAVLLTAGFNDPRLVIWQPAKMAARLQAATASGKPVLLRVEFHAGHGLTSTRKQGDEELADMFAFLLQQLFTRWD
jgi:prolyl oligopeptidase